MQSSRRQRRGRYLLEHEEGRRHSKPARQEVEHDVPRSVRAPRVNPGTAALLSFFIPGTGFIYIGRIGVGFGVLIVNVLFAVGTSALFTWPSTNPAKVVTQLFVVVGWLVFWIWQIREAHRVAAEE